MNTIAAPAASQSTEQPASKNDIFLQMTSITKSFPGVLALADADLDVKEGEIHGLVGKNGAGKSTLMSILMGLQHPDSGTIAIDGVEQKNVTPHAMLEAGIAHVPQHIKMLNTLTVAENVLVGDLPKNRFGLISWKETYAVSEQRLRKLGLKLNVRLPVEGLGVADKTILAIAKALFSNARLIILDEPTAVLTRKDTNVLFSFVRSLREQGLAFIYISHHLEEIFEICDRVTVMRDGQVVGTKRVSTITTPELIQMMIGEVVADYQRHKSTQNQEVFSVENLSRRGHYDNISLKLYRGEIVGLCGLQASGVGELAKALFGLERRGIGDVKINGQPLTVETPHKAFQQGLAYLPDDRHRFSLVGLRSVRENITYSVLDNLAKVFGILSRTEERRLVASYIDRLGIVTASQEQQAQLLSGGNQQKVVFARLAATKPSVLLLHEPTQGVDIRAKVDIFNIINELANQGVAILIISSEVRELVGLCDRIQIMYEGRLTHEFNRDLDNFQPEKILLAIEGSTHDAEKN